MKEPNQQQNMLYLGQVVTGDHYTANCPKQNKKRGANQADHSLPW